jgi:excisionase family DNA binding protein
MTQQPAIAPIALSAEQVAELLGVSRAHVWRMLKRGQLPTPARLGRLSRWDRRTVEAWLAAGAPAARHHENGADFAPRRTP